MWRRRPRTHDDFTAEIGAHLEEEAARLVDDGVPPDEARDRARRAFGSVLTAQERFHDTTRWRHLEQVVQDLRYAARSLLRSPAFTATTVLTLAVALSLTTIVFAIFNAYVLRPFAVRDPYALHGLSWRAPEASGRSFTWRDYETIRDRRDLFDDVIAERQRLVSSSGLPLSAAFVSDGYFDALGPRLQIGRGLGALDGRPPGVPVAVLSHQAWDRFFRRDPKVVGRALTINARPYVIVGVLGAEFGGLDDSPRDVWLPLALHTEVLAQDLRGPDQPRELGLTTRLKAGVTAEQAAAALTPIVADALETIDGLRVELTPQPTPIPFSFELVAMLSPVFAAFALVLVAACANVSNVMLARACARHREIGVRLSLGASRGRVVRQLLTEGLLIAAIGGAGALAIALAALRVGPGLFLASLPPWASVLVRVVPLDVDVRVAVFAFGLAAATTLLFALLPALQATRLSLTHALRGEAGAVLRTSRLRSLLVASQVAVSLVLVVAAATLTRNGVTIAATDLGMDTREVYSVNQRGERSDHVGPAAELLARDPRVGAVVVTSRNPLLGRLPRLPLRPTDASAVIATSYLFVSPEYFGLLGIPVVRGRGFLPEEARTEAPVAIISAAGARALWPGADPLGRVIRVPLEPLDDPAADATATRRDRFANAAATVGDEVTIIGVAADVVSGLVYDGPDAAHLYLPTSPTGARVGALLVRSRSARDLRLDSLRRLLEQTNADPLAFETLPLDELVEMQRYPLRAASWIGTLLGAIALGLSVSGLYGVLSYTLSQRSREIGIRMALGATAGAVVRLVVSQSARLAGLGGAVGLIVAFAVMRVLSALVRLSNVSLLDAVAFMAAIVLVGATALLAAYGPARRATRVDPARTLRGDA